MRAVELSLADWLELYKELCEAERLLSEAEAATDDRASTQMRADVARLQVEVDAALQVVNDEISARRKRAA